MEKHKLKLNDDKSEFIMISSPHNRKEINGLKVQIGEETLIVFDIISCLELKIRWEVLDWSAGAPHLRLNISVAIDTRLSKSKIWNL